MLTHKGRLCCILQVADKLQCLGTNEDVATISTDQTRLFFSDTFHTDSAQLLASSEKSIIPRIQLMYTKLYHMYCRPLEPRLSYDEKIINIINLIKIRVTRTCYRER